MNITATARAKYRNLVGKRVRHKQTGNTGVVLNSFMWRSSFDSREEWAHGVQRDVDCLTVAWWDENTEIL